MNDVKCKCNHYISGLWCQRHVSRAWLSNYIPQNSVECNCQCCRYLLLVPKSSFYPQNSSAYQWLINSTVLEDIWPAIWLHCVLIWENWDWRSTLVSICPDKITLYRHQGTLCCILVSNTLTVRSHFTNEFSFIIQVLWNILLLLGLSRPNDQNKILHMS